jgi:hypothetical protein
VGGHCPGQEEGTVTGWKESQTWAWKRKGFYFKTPIFTLGQKLHLFLNPVIKISSCKLNI